VYIDVYQSHTAHCCDRLLSGNEFRRRVYVIRAIIHKDECKQEFL